MTTPTATTPAEKVELDRVHSEALAANPIVLDHEPTETERASINTAWQAGYGAGCRFGIRVGILASIRVETADRATVDEARLEGRREMAEYASAVLADSPAAVLAAAIAATPRTVHKAIIREGGQITAIVETAE